MKTYFVTTAVSAALAVALLAHHGSEFITLHDYDIGHAGDGNAQFNFEWESEDDHDELSVEPSIFYSPISRLGIGAALRFEDDDESDWEYSSVTPFAQVQLTDPHSDWWLDIGLSFGYQFADGQAEAESDDEHGHGEEEHGHGHGHGEEEESGHGHSGIHNHDVDQWLARLILETEIGKTKVTGNVISTYPEGDDANWGYGIGVRHPVGERLALGVEAIGDFESDGEHEVVGSVHYSLSARATARIGVGFGLTDESPDFSLQTGLVWKF